MTRILALLTALTAVSAPALAQDAEPAVKYKERTEIDFESVDVTGELVKPEGQLLLSRKKANFNPLIRLREHFDDRIRDTAGAL